MKKRLLLILILFYLAYLPYGQPYYFRNYQVSDGISSNTITSILQDNRGFMWFGTRNGLNRFDGIQFKIFRNNSKDVNSIGSNSILSLYEDQQQHLWVGTYKGVYLYDAFHENFTLFTQLPQHEIRSINSDPSNNIWFVIGFILYKYNTSSHVVSSYSIAKTQIPVLSIGKNGTVWCGTDSGMIKKYDPLKDKFINSCKLPLTKKEESVFIQTIYPASDSTLLISTFKQSFLLNTKTTVLTNIFRNYPWANNIQVHKIIRESASSYWFGTENGLYILDLKTETVQLIQKQNANPYSLNDNVITDFCLDKEGNTWVGTFFGGVNFYSKQLNQFQKYFPLPGVNSLSGSLVHEICTDRNNNIWIGTEDAGLNKLNQQSGIITHYMPGKGSGYIAYQNIHGLMADNNELWIGTYEHGLDVMDLSTEKVVRHYEKSSKPNSLNSNFIVTIYKTRNGKILIGTWGGLFEFDRQKNNFISLPFFNRQAQAILEDENGTIWVCSYGNGVYFYNPANGIKGSFTFNAKDSNSLPNNYVNNLFEDSKRNIWFCTESGLCRYDFLLKKIVRFTDDFLLGNNQIFRVLEDNSGILWISTSKGLVRMNPTSKETKLFNTDNGLLTEQFNYNSAYKNKEGKLFFGTEKGMISFDPLQFSRSSFIPPVYITSIYVNNQELNVNHYRSLSDNTGHYTAGLTLPYDSSNINIDVAALSFSIPGRNEYSYKMEGVDKDWNYIKNNPKIYYTKLSPGNYTFKVKGSNSDGIWNPDETILTIHITPPFWASIWAYLLYMFVILGIVFTILRYYYIALSEKNQRKIKVLEIEKEREIYNAKIEFFTNVTHEIRTPLTLIKLPVEKLLQTVSSNSNLFENLVMIEKNTNRLIHLTDQLLDFRKAEANHYSLNFVKTDINELLKELYATYHPAAEEKCISFKLELPRVPLLAYVDPEAFRKLLSNLFNNAIKYADHLITIRLMPFSSEDTVFNIEFKNDGYLIPFDLKEKIFEPFYRLKQTEKSAGTGIGLPLSRSLAELHKGVLDLKQPDGHFNTFLLTIPIHQEKEINLGEQETETALIAQSADPEINEPKKDENKISILLVEDDREIVHFLQKELMTDYNIFKAFNGREALEILLKENINLVISDIMMPIMDGIELCRQMKTDLNYSHIPIILLTAKNTLTAKIEGLETGADAYIEKPFVLKYLQAQITNLLSNRNIVKEYYAHSPLAHIRGIACTTADKGFLESLHQVIEENITERELDVDTLSRMMNMSRGTFYRKIKGLSDLTPNELITLARLKKAAELLANGNYRVNEVSNMVGYSLQSNFARDFHKQFNITPTNYIKQQGGRK